MAANTKHRIQPKDRNSVATGPHKDHKLATTTSQTGRLEGLVAVFSYTLVLGRQLVTFVVLGMWGGHGVQRIWMPQIIRYLGSSIIHKIYKYTKYTIVFYVTGPLPNTGDRMNINGIASPQHRRSSCRTADTRSPSWSVRTDYSSYLTTY